MIHQLDLEVLYFFNHFTGNVASLDKIIFFISNNHLFKGGLFALIIWILWFNRKSKKNYRPILVLNIFGCFVTMFIARVLNKSLPFRPRPIHNPLLDINEPIGLPDRYVSDMSSFPSDHAALFFALATGIYFVSKKLGVLSLLYALLIICLPRVFLGLHYPSDILGGALIGIIVIVAINKINYFNRVQAPLFEFKKNFPSLFYAGFFLITYQIADMFESIRAVITFTYSFMNH